MTRVARSVSVAKTTRISGLVVVLWLSAYGGGHAQSPAPFDRLAGQWSGNGTIDLSNGAHEPIKCRASYDVLDQRNKLQFNIRCASDSYNFELRGSANSQAGAVTGTWSESTRNAAGTISGKVEGDRFQVLAEGSSFSATLTLVTHGNRQSVVIRSQAQGEQTNVKGASFTLQRGG